MALPKYIISKSDFITARKCLLRFWHEVHQPEKLPALTEFDKALLKSGREVGEIARQAYPGGVLIAPGPGDAERTRAAMADPNVPAIYEATFRTDSEVVKVDVLRRRPDGDWDLLEVKAASQAKDLDIFDVAFQVWVLQKTGVPVRNSFIVHPDPDYVRGDAVDPSLLFREVSVHSEAISHQEAVERDLAYYHSVLQAPNPPPETGLERCKCELHERLNTPNPIDHLPFLSQKARGKLFEAGITDITQIPPDFEWISGRQMRVRNAVVTGEPYFDHESLAEALFQVEYPIRFIDFETFDPAIPLYRGTRPFQTVPFQWSLHSLHADGSVDHREFLHLRSGEPPFRAFVESLLDALEDQGTIVVYSGHERRTLTSVAEQVPELRAEIFDSIDRQLDLLKLMRANVYHPGFRGSHSLKKVLPVLVPGLSYEGLEIQDGGHAAGVFAEIMRPSTSASRRIFLSNALLRYCERDTEALLRIFLALQEEIQHRRQRLMAPRGQVRAASSRR